MLYNSVYESDFSFTLPPFAKAGRYKVNVRILQMGKGQTTALRINLLLITSIISLE